MRAVQHAEWSRSASQPRSRSGLGALATLASLALVSGAAPAAAWTPATQLEIARRAASIAPPDLRRQIERHQKAFESGALLPFRSSDSTLHVKNPDGSGRLDQVILAETREAIRDIRAHRPFEEIVARLGRISHYVADANNPLSASEADPREPTYLDDYRRYVESAQGRFAVVFYGEGRALESGAALPTLVTRTLARSRNLYPEVGREYQRVGTIRGSQLFDDRSTAFGVASLAFSHAVSDVAAIMRHVWIEAGGADGRRLPWTNTRSAARRGSR